MKLKQLKNGELQLNTGAFQDILADWPKFGGGLIDNHEELDIETKTHKLVIGVNTYIYVKSYKTK